LFLVLLVVGSGSVGLPVDYLDFLFGYVEEVYLPAVEGLSLVSVFGYLDRYLGPELSVQGVDEFHDVLGVAAYLFIGLDLLAPGVSLGEGISPTNPFFAR
jgi:hypothetical protein